MVPFPAGKQMFPQLLRAAGYYCTNNAKEDYNLATARRMWDESSRTAHWKNRPPATPFFAVFNSEKSHESQIRKRPHAAVHDPAKVRVPAYHPDTPEVRQDWAQYYDCVTAADADAGQRLKELEQAGLVDETIVFYFADHGSGMPRNKRWPYNAGLQVPLIVSIPEKFRHLRPADYVDGGKSERLVSFVDFAPTMLSLAGVKPPAWMQGQAFLGHHAEQPREYLFGFRGRMDERNDLVRTDRRTLCRTSATTCRTRSTASISPTCSKRPRHASGSNCTTSGQLTAAQDAFWREEAPRRALRLVERSRRSHQSGRFARPCRGAQAAARREAQTLPCKYATSAFCPRGKFTARSTGSSPYDMGHDDTKYPLERILSAAEVASSLKPDDESLRRLTRRSGQRFAIGERSGF